jgi:hypothetical protein
LSAKLLAGFKDKEWKKRKDTADAIIEILKAAKMRIEPNGLGDLMEALKASMKEANKAVWTGINNYMDMCLARVRKPRIKRRGS